MKKFLKIFTFCALISGLIALIVCYIVIPTQTKAAADVVVGYLNTPIGIAGGTTITLGCLVMIIIKMIYDRYKASIKSDLKAAKEYIDQKYIEAKEYYEKGEKLREETCYMLSVYSTELEELSDKLVKVCKIIPNVKVNALGKEIATIKEETKKELVANIKDLENDTKATIEKYNKVDEIYKQLELLQKHIGLENSYGEERTHN